MKILVIGDVMLDINYYSEINRIAPEANIGIHNIYDIKYNLGGASNVAKNLNLLNANVTLVSVIGNDYHSTTIIKLLDDNLIKNKIFYDNDRKTTQKHRIINDNLIKVRYDIETTDDISDDYCNKIINFVKEQKHLDAIVISDYNKGVITEKLCQAIINYSNENNIFTFVDPKVKNFLKYKNCFCFKPNLMEAEILTSTKDISQMFDIIKEQLNPTHIVITLGNKGMYVDSTDKHLFSNEQINAIDVTGAGDVVIATLVYCFIKYKDIIIASEISNYIAGKSVQVIGNYNINLNDIENKYNLFTAKTLGERIVLNTDIERLKLFQNKNVVFTNGCFDIVHSAHLELLNFCKKQGDILIVGLNSDCSIKRLKGEKRPINDIYERSLFLLNLSIVDYIVIFNEDTPYNIINLIRPKILVKGGDYKKENIIGYDLVQNIVIYEFKKNKSTTNLINKILLL